MCIVPAFIFLLIQFTGLVISGCPEEWTQLIQSNKCVAAFGTELAFFDALLYCQNIAPNNGGSLVSIHNTFQNAQLSALGQKKSTDCLFWIGVYDFDDSGQYSWIDQTNMDYSNWAPGCPTATSEDTVAFMNLIDLSKNRWEDTSDLSAELCFFCQQNSNQAPQITTTTTIPVITSVSTTTTRPGDCGQGWARFGGSCYKVFMLKQTFAEALTYCKSQGAHLATLESQDELDFAAGVFHPLIYYGWIGLANLTGDGWKWIDGEPLNDDSWCRCTVGGPPCMPNHCCPPGPIECGMFIGSHIQPCVGDDGCEQTNPFMCEHED